MSFEYQLKERQRRLAQVGQPLLVPVSRPIATYGIVTIKANGQRKKIHTKQIQTKSKTKGKKSKGRKITKNEQVFMRAKRLQQYALPEEASLVHVPPPPKRLTPISYDEKNLRQFNLREAEYTQNIEDIPYEILHACLPDRNSNDGVVKKLRDYQTRVVQHMLNNRGLIVVHSLGSGKTLIAATSAICMLRTKPFLRVIFIGPKSLLSNFKRTVAESYSDVNWDMISMYTYEKFRIDQNKGLIDCYNTYLIVDEAHRLRTHSNKNGITTSATVKAVLNCARKSPKVLLLTATPVVNDPYDIVNLVSIIRGEKGPMSKKFFRKTIYSKKGVLVNQQTFNNYFYNTVSVYIRDQDDTYPSVTTHTVKIPMSDIYYSEYKRVEEELITAAQQDILGPSDLKPFYNGVRRTVNADIEEYNSKLDWVRNHLLKYNNRKMVIFSPFVSLGVKQLEILVNDFDVVPRIGIITGSDKAADRQKTIDLYNNDQIQILILSIGAGGVGINLIGTRDVVIMQLGWNDVETEQATGRAIRFLSHIHLPPTERHVDVWKLLLVKPAHIKGLSQGGWGGLGGDLAIDEIIRNIGKRKSAIIRPFMKHLTIRSIENNQK